MKDKNLRDDLIRLAFDEPDLRPSLLPLLTKTASGPSFDEVARNWENQCWDTIQATALSLKFLQKPIGHDSPRLLKGSRAATFSLWSPNVRSGSVELALAGSWYDRTLKNWTVLWAARYMTKPFFSNDKSEYKEEKGELFSFGATESPDEVAQKVARELSRMSLFK